MPYFDNEGVKIYYEMEGTGPDLIMIHGFASNIDDNWRATNWIKTLKDSNRLILLDCRGHGKSDKPTDPTQYGLKMMEDAIKLLDHLSVEKANFFGYSMGSRLTLNALLHESKRVKSAILGGFALSDEPTTFIYEGIVKALKAESVDQIKNRIAQEFRKFAETRSANLNALAAVMSAYVQQPDVMFTSKAKIRKNLKKISVPVLTVVGSDDFIRGDKALFAKLVPNACHFQIQGRDHLTVVPDPKFHMVVKAFLNYVNKI